MTIHHWVTKDMLTRESKSKSTGHSLHHELQREKGKIECQGIVDLGLAQKAVILYCQGLCPEWYNISPCSCFLTWGIAPSPGSPSTASCPSGSQITLAPSSGHGNTKYNCKQKLFIRFQPMCEIPMSEILHICSVSSPVNILGSWS